MITFKNGWKEDVFVASGALGFKGNGWWWEKPLVWTGILRPQEFTVIAKTVTFNPRKGNWTRWYWPWNCIKLLGKQNTVNAVGLTNKGYKHWLFNCYPYVIHSEIPTIASVMPDTVDEAAKMGCAFDQATILKAVEINVSCPSVEHDKGASHVCRLVEAFASKCRLPLIVKLGWQDPIIEIGLGLEEIKQVEAVDLINTVPWPIVYPKDKSPLAKHGLVGGVSGPAIKTYSRQALIKWVDAKLRIPVISGGGIMDEVEGASRFVKGAKAISLGTLFTYRPWAANGVAKRIRQTVRGD